MRASDKDLPETKSKLPWNQMRLSNLKSLYRFYASSQWKLVYKISIPIWNACKLLKSTNFKVCLMNTPKKFVYLAVRFGQKNPQAVIQCSALQWVRYFHLLSEQSFDMKSSFYQLSNRSSNEIVEARKFV